METQPTRAPSPADRRDEEPVQQSRSHDLIRMEIRDDSTKLIVAALKRLEAKFNYNLGNSSPLYTSVKNIVTSTFETVTDPDFNEIIITRTVLERLSDAIKLRGQQTPNTTSAVFDAMFVGVSSLINQIDFHPKTDPHGAQDYVNSKEFWAIWIDIVMYYNALTIQSTDGIAEYIEKYSSDKGVKSEMTKLRMGLTFIDKPGNVYKGRDPAKIEPKNAASEGFF